MLDSNLDSHGIIQRCRKAEVEVISGAQWLALRGPADHELLDYGRADGGTCYHAICTCMMGSHPMSVVDSELRVHGLDGLRVIDASVMPSVTRGNTNAATIAIAERAADLVRGVEPLVASVGKAATAAA